MLRLHMVESKPLQMSDPLLGSPFACCIPGALCYVLKQKGASILLAFAQHKQMPCPYRAECSLECLEPLLASNVECDSWLFQGQPITVTESNLLFNKWLIPDMYWGHMSISIHHPTSISRRCSTWTQRQGRNERACKSDSPPAWP